MNLKDTKSAYFEGQITKPQYINSMYELHLQMLEYADFLKDTDIGKIEITDDGVVMTSRTTGVKIYCDRYDKRLAPLEILNFNFYEKTDFNMIVKLIASLMTQRESEINFFDIGANIGWYTINLAKTFEKIKIFAFEPIPKTFLKLEINVELNLLNNVSLCNFGFSNQEQELIFYYYPEGSGNASSVNLSELDSVETIPCHVKRLDDFTIQNNFQVDFIKCDVEGAELFVFQGGIESIKKHQPIIFTEMLRKWSAKFDYHPNEIIELLSGIGYRCFVAKEEYLVQFFRMDENTVETNFFFLHSVCHRSLISSLSSI